MNNLLGQYLQNAFSKNLFISMSPDHRNRSAISFFFHLNNQICSIVDFIKTWDEHTRLYFSRSLEVACHKLSHFNSLGCILDFTWSNCTPLEAKKFSRKPRQFKWVAREIRCHLFILELLKQNLLSQIEESFQRHRTTLKIIFLSEDQDYFFINHRG